jgi:hypothetical protein
MDEVKKAIVVILKDEKSYCTSLNYAVAYCSHAMRITDPHEMKVQILYILNNISHWRHPEAKNVRMVLKKFAGIK